MPQKRSYRRWATPSLKNSDDAMKKHIFAAACGLIPLFVFCSSAPQIVGGHLLHRERALLDTLADDVRAHLALASRVLADLRPRSGGARAASSTST